MWLRLDANTWVNPDHIAAICRAASPPDGRGAEHAGPKASVMLDLADSDGGTVGFSAYGPDAVRVLQFAELMSKAGASPRRALGELQAMRDGAPPAEREADPFVPRGIQL